MTAETRWDVYVGDMFEPPDYVHMHAIEDTYDDARIDMLGALRQWLHDECPTCQRDGTQAARQLLHLTEPQAWETEIEGDLYRISPVPP
jgi:hypothetical protein